MIHQELTFPHGRDGNIPPVRFQRAADIHISTRQEHDAILHFRRGGRSHILGIQKRRAVITERQSACLKILENRSRADGGVLPHGRHAGGSDDHAILRIDLSVYRDGRGHEIVAGFLGQILQGQIIQRRIGQIQVLPIAGRGPQGESAHIDDPRRTYRNALGAEEIHIAADLIVLDGIHDAVDVDFAIHHIDLMIHIAKLQIGDVTTGDIKLREVVQRFIAFHLLVLDGVLRAAGNLLLHHLVRIGLIPHHHIGIRHAAAKKRCKQYKSPKRFPASGRRCPAMIFRNLRGHHIAAPRGIPDDFIYLIHGSSMVGGF